MEAKKVSHKLQLNVNEGEKANEMNQKETSDEASNSGSTNVEDWKLSRNLQFSSSSVKDVNISMCSSSPLENSDTFKVSDILCANSTLSENEEDSDDLVHSKPSSATQSSEKLCGSKNEDENENENISNESHRSRSSSVSSQDSIYSRSASTNPDESKGDASAHEHRSLPNANETSKRRRSSSNSSEISEVSDDSDRCSSSLSDYDDVERSNKPKSLKFPSTTSKKPTPRYKKHRIPKSSHAVIESNIDSKENHDEKTSKNPKKFKNANSNDQKEVTESNKVSDGKVNDQQKNDDEDEDEDEDDISPSDVEYEFLCKKIKKKPRTEHEKEIIDENFELAQDLIWKMKEAYDEDKRINESGETGFNMVNLLDTVLFMMVKVDIRQSLIDLNFLGILNKWLAPKKNGKLPLYHIRTKILKKLSEEFTVVDKEALKESGIGKTLKLLANNPNETRENRNLAQKIVHDWYRIILNIRANFHGMSLDERKEYFANVPQYSELEKDRINFLKSKNIVGLVDLDMTEKEELMPGDPGFKWHTQVPEPSNKIFVIRPPNNVEPDYSPSINSRPSVHQRICKKIRQMKRRC